jgi:hypothetical protein
MRRLTLSLLSIVFVLAGCEVDFHLSTARLSDPAMSTAVDSNSQAPLEKATIFSADVKKLYATIQVKNAPADTKIRAVFSYLEGTRQQIAEDTIAAEGSKYLSFSLNPPESGWPVGRYEVEFYLNNEVKEKIGFSVVPAAGMPASKGFPTSENQQSAPPAQTAPTAGNPAAAAPEPAVPAVPTVPPATTAIPPAAPVPPQGQQSEAVPLPPSQPGVSYKTFQDKQFGFAFELPENWTFQTIGANSDYLFSGQAGSPESEISVIVQIVDIRKGVVGSLKDQMLALLQQFSQMPGAKIESKSQTQVAGGIAPFFLVTYPAENTKKQKVRFGHTQLGLDHPPYLFLISYSAPRDIYQQNVATFQHMIDSLKLTPPAQ